jgi:hypothetical protein
MWNTFAELIKNTSTATKTASTVVPYKYLTASSPRQPTPPHAAIKLWPHQEAMLARCLYIEASNRKATPIIRHSERYMNAKNIPTFNEVSIGVMNDPPGSGKTYAILSLLVTSPLQGINLIVVPQNIYCQWESAINTIFPDTTSVPRKFCNSFAAISDFYMDPHIAASYKIILVNDLFADQLAGIISEHSIPITRLIVDEIDSIQKRMLNPVQAKHVWLLSASFVYDEYLTTIGPYKINNNDLEHVICKCESRFVGDHFGMTDPSTQFVLCDDTDIMLFKDMKESVINALNAGDSGPLLKTMSRTYPPDRRGLRDLATALTKELDDRAEELEAQATSIMKDSATFSKEKLERLTAERTRFLKEAAAMRSQSAAFAKRIQDTSGVVSTLPLKSTYFAETICQQIKTNPHSKWLIFNDNHTALFQAQRVLAAHDISGQMIDGGSAPAIAAAIKSYKEGDTQVLLLNSSTEGAGMNLENTTHMLFMHATDERLLSQVIGRAQRFGRIGQLLIICMFNNNEYGRIMAGT